MLWTLVSLVVYGVACVGLLLASYWLLDLLTPGHLTRIIKHGGWNAAVLAAANLIAVALIITSVMFGQPVSAEGLIRAIVFAVAGAIFQAIGLLVIRVVWMARDDLESVLTSPTVTPVGVFLASAALALGICVAVAVH